MGFQKGFLEYYIWTIQDSLIETIPEKKLPISTGFLACPSCVDKLVVGFNKNHLIQNI
jgi:hypothetical protein